MFFTLITSALSGMPFMHLGGHDRGKKWYYFSMFRLLKKYTKDGWWAALLGPVFTAAEVAVDALIPLPLDQRLAHTIKTISHLNPLCSAGKGS